jgi:hypothetical protein
MAARSATSATALPLALRAARPDRLALARRVERWITASMCFAHTCGTIDVVILLLWALPAPPGAHLPRDLVPAGVAFALYAPFAMVVGTVLGRRVGPLRREWLLLGTPPTPEERDSVLRASLMCTLTDAALWLGGALLFAATTLPRSPALALHGGLLVLLGGAFSSLWFQRLP